MTYAALAEKSSPICGGAATAQAVVDFNKSRIEGSGTFLPLTGIPISYYLCQKCGFCWAPEMNAWSALPRC